MNQPKAIYTGISARIDQVYGTEEVASLEERFALVRIPDLRDAPSVSIPSDTKYIFGTWGLPWMDGAFLDRLPHLKAVFYAAGSIKGFAAPDLWDRGIPVFSAWAANAVPVAEWSLAQIILCLKRTWPAVRRVRETQCSQNSAYHAERVPGAYGSTVGLLSLGMIGTMVAERLRALDVNVLAYDPFAQHGDAAALGVRLASLEEVFAGSDVVSCHTPWLKETEKMLRREHFASMRPSASFLNTARGAVVDEEGLIAVLQERSDLTAVLDVTWPEPPVEGSPLYALPNLVLTPHIAGSQQDECRRMARYMIEEYDRFAAGKPTRWQISMERAATMA